MSKLKKRTILGMVVLWVILVAWIAFATYKRHHSPLYEQVTINKDTGQTIINTPNQAPENGGNNNQVTTLGSDKFLEAGMTQAQFSLTIQLLTTYVHQNLHGQYQQLAILNAGFKSTGNNIYAQMRPGNSSKLLNININYYNLYVVRLKVSDPGGDSAYSYDSGPHTAPVPADQGTGE